MRSAVLLPLLMLVAGWPARPAAAPAASGKPAASGAQAEPAAILEQVSRAYRAFDRYHFEGRMTVDVGFQGQTQNVQMPFTLAVAKPGRKRIEITNPMLQMVVVSDGDSTWMYIPQLGQYTQKVMTPLGDDASPLGPAAAGTPVARYLAMGDGLASSRVVGEASIPFGGAARPCWVVEATYQAPAAGTVQASPTTFWIDRTRHIVLRESTLVKVAESPNGPMSMNQVTTFEIARLDEALPDSLFAFQPPAGARLVDEIAVPGAQQPESELVGKPAAPFTLKNLAGKPVSLASWKGKVVLLDFWASWCGPCRIEMPTIAKLDKELKSKGLVVVGVNVGETASVASGYLKKNQFGFPVVLDSDSQIAEKYGASGLPTVVIIDKSGNVSSHFIGVRSEEVLREALKKAGIN